MNSCLISYLQPSCNYLLALKSSRSNVHVERTIPAAVPVAMDKQDVIDVNMIAIRPKTNMDVSLLVKVKKADSVKNIKAKLFCGGGDSPVHMVKMDGQKFVIFPSIPLDGSECYITVEASATQVLKVVILYGIFWYYLVFCFIPWHQGLFKHLNICIIVNATLHYSLG